MTFARSLGDTEADKLIKNEYVWIKRSLGVGVTVSTNTVENIIKSPHTITPSKIRAIN